MFPSFAATKQFLAWTKPFSPLAKISGNKDPLLLVAGSIGVRPCGTSRRFRLKSLKASRVMKARSKSEIDEYIGARIREGRVALHLSQELLAAALGVSFQQIQNYEKGANGVSAVRLFDICKILNVSWRRCFRRSIRRIYPVPLPNRRWIIIRQGRA